MGQLDIMQPVAMYVFKLVDYCGSTIARLLGWRAPTNLFAVFLALREHSHIADFM
jgi:hypothetical protein